MITHLPWDLLQGKARTMQTIPYVPSHTLIRQALADHGPWLSSRLGCSLADTVILRSHFVFMQLGFTLLGDSKLAHPRSRKMQAVHRELECVTLPPGVPSIIDLHERVGESAIGAARLTPSVNPCALTWPAARSHSSCALCLSS